MAVRMRLPLQLSKVFLPFGNQKLVHTEAGATEPAYPPIRPSLTAKSKASLLQANQIQIEKIRASPVDEKLAIITSKRRNKYIINPQTFAFNGHKWYQHFTKTAYIPGLPDKFTAAAPQSSPSSEPGIDDAAFMDIRDLMTRVILHEHCHKLKKRKPFVYKWQEMLVGPFLRNLVSELTYTLCKYNPLLQLSSLDISPQVSFYWRKGIKIVERGHRRGRQEPIRFQINDRPLCQIRTTQQLPQFTPMESSYTAELLDYPYSPCYMPLFRKQEINLIFTGAKRPDPVCYGHTQFHLVPDRYHRNRMARKNLSDQVEVFLKANAVASLFAWTGAQAMYQGFWDYEDLTRPFVSQAIISDGHFFSFFCYQLNTLALAVETDANNPRKNLLWGTESLRLYEDVQDGEVVGLNDDVIKLLVQFLLNQPESLAGEKCAGKLVC